MELKMARKKQSFTVRKNAELRINPLKNPVRTNIVLEHDSLVALKMRAAQLDTTFSEIVRRLVDDFLSEGA